MAKSMLEKMGLIKPILSEEDYSPSSSSNEMTVHLEDMETGEEIIANNVESFDEENYINDVYAANDLIDTSKSIYRVNEVIKSFPSEMPTAVKRTSVQAILNTFGITVQDVVADSEVRQHILQKVNQDFITGKMDEVKELNHSIEQRKIEIAKMEKQVIQLTKEAETSDDLISNEIELIRKVTGFLEGEE